MGISWGRSSCSNRLSWAEENITYSTVAINCVCGWLAIVTYWRGLSFWMVWTLLSSHRPPIILLHVHMLACKSREVILLWPRTFCVTLILSCTLIIVLYACCKKYIRLCCSLSQLLFQIHGVLFSDQLIWTYIWPACMSTKWQWAGSVVWDTLLTTMQWMGTIIWKPFWPAIVVETNLCE